MTPRTRSSPLAGSLAAFAVFAAAGPAAGAGFAIHEQGAAATGRAGADTAIAATPSAIYYNPAGLGFQEGLGVEIGDTLIVPLATQEDPATGVATDAQVGLFYPPSGYASYLLPGRVALGVGAFVPYGLGIAWPEGWAGFEEVQAIELQIFFVNPTVAWNPVEWLSIGAGFDAVRAIVELEKGLDFVDDRGTLHGAAGAWGFGGNAGVLVRLLDGRLSFGASYRSAVALDFSGNADFTVPPSFASMLEDQPLESSLTLPHTISIGIAGVPHPMLLLDLDVVVTTWSTFDQFGFSFPQDAGKPEDERLSQFDRRDWTDVVAVRLGAEVRPPVDGLALRAGLVYDQSPSPSNTLSPSLPDSDRIDVAAGVGYALPFGLSLDLAYMYVRFLERSSAGEAFPATYRASAHLIGLSVGYRYDPDSAPDELAAGP